MTFEECFLENWYLLGEHKKPPGTRCFWNKRTYIFEDSRSGCFWTTFSVAWTFQPVSIKFLKRCLYGISSRASELRHVLNYRTFTFLPPPNKFVFRYYFRLKRTATSWANLENLIISRIIRNTPCHVTI